MIKIVLIILCLTLGRELVGSVWSSEQSFYDNYSGEDILYSSDNQYKPEFSLHTDANLLAGQNFQVNCSCRPPVNCSGCNIDINSLKVKHCNSSDRASCMVVKDTVIIDNRTISLVRPSLSEQDTGTYFCQYNNSPTTEDNFYLKIGYKPFGPQNISCVSNDMSDLNCSWTKSKQDKENPLPVVYKSFYDISPMYGKINCPHPQLTKRDQTSCYIAPSSKNEDCTFHPGNSYNVTVIASNVCAFQMTEHTVNIEKIIKLSSPKVSLVSKNGTKIVLSTLQSMAPFINIWIGSILYDVVYTMDTITNTTQFNSPNESNIIILRDLIPYTAYNVTVKAKVPQSKGDKYWSPTVTGTYTTDAAAPVSVPYIGGYIMSNRVLSLYIRPISKREKFSEKAFYTVTVNSTSEGSVNRQFDVPWDIATINVTNLPQNLSYLIEVKTVNDIGESIDSSRIATPLYDSGRQKPAYIVVEGSEKNYIVSWNKQSRNISCQLEKIVVYWCVGIQTVCQSDLSLINASRDLTNISVTTDREDRWIFAVSYLYTDGYNTEMVFSKCHFPYFTGSPLGISDISVIPESETKLVVKPGDYCNINKYPSRPLVYTVYYRKSDDSIKSCDNTFLNKRVEANMKTGGITLENLKPSTNYAVCLGVTSNGDDEVISKPQIALTFSEDAPKTLPVGIIALVICSILLILGITFCLCKFRNMYKKHDTSISTVMIIPYKPLPSFDIEKQKEKNGGTSSDSGVSSMSIHNDINLPEEELSNHTGISSPNLPISDSNSPKDIPVNDTLESRQNNEKLTECRSEDKVWERDRTVSDVTDGYTGTFKSSTTSKSSTSNHTSITNSSRISRPKQKRSSVLDRFESEIREETSNSSSICVPLMEKNSADEIKNKKEFVRDWLRKSREDLQDSNNIQLQTFTSEKVKDQVENYVEVDVDGSLKSDSVNQSSKVHSNSNHSNNICSNSTVSDYTDISDIINQNSSNHSDRSNSKVKSDNCRSENGNSEVQCSTQMKESCTLSNVQSDNLNAYTESVNSEEKDSNQIGENSLSSYVQSDILSTFSENSNEGSNTSSPAVKMDTSSLNSTSEKSNEGSFTSSPTINIDTSSLNCPLEKSKKGSNTNTPTINIDTSSLNYELEKSKQKNIQNKLINQDKVEKFAVTNSQYLPHNIQILTIKEANNFSDNGRNEELRFLQDENSGDISSGVSDYLKAGQCDTNSGSEVGECDTSSGSEQISSYTFLNSVGENS